MFYIWFLNNGIIKVYFIIVGLLPWFIYILYHGNDSAYFVIFLNIIVFPKLSILYNLYVVSKSLYNKSFILLVKVNEKMNLFS